MAMVFMFKSMINLNWFLWYKGWHKSDIVCLKLLTYISSCSRSICWKYIPSPLNWFGQHSIIHKRTHHFLDSLFCPPNFSFHPSTNTDYYNHTLVSKSGSKILQSYFSFSRFFWLIYICCISMYVLEST